MSGQIFLEMKLKFKILKMDGLASTNVAVLEKTSLTELSNF